MVVFEFFPQLLSSEVTLPERHLQLFLHTSTNPS